MSPDTDRSFEVLRAVRDLGLRRPAATAVTARVHAALERAIELERLGTERDIALDRRRARHRFTTWPPLRRLAAVTPHVASAALVAVTVVVAVGAILLLGHGRQARVAAGSSAGSSHQELLRTLGILRTHPTPTDRGLAACIERSTRQFGRFPGDSCLLAVPETIQIVEHPASVAASFIASLRYPRFDLGLIRSVTLAGSGDRVTFFPASWRSSPPSAPRTWGVVVGLVYNHVDEIDVLPTSLDTLRGHGIALFPAYLYNGRPKDLTFHEGAIIVPNGVAKVKVGNAILGRGSSVLENVTAVVHDNVATVTLKMPTFKTGFGFGPGSALQVTWLDAHGRVVRRTTNALWSSGQVSPQ